MSRHDVNFMLFFLTSAAIITPQIVYTSLFNININWQLDWKIGFLKRVPISKSSQWDKGILSRLQINQAKKWMPWFCRETVIRYFLLIPVYCIVMITWLELCKYYLLGSSSCREEKGIPLSWRFAVLDCWCLFHWWSVYFENCTNHTGFL